MGTASSVMCEPTDAGTVCTCPSGTVQDGQGCTAVYTAVAVSETFTCAIRADETLWCWGQQAGSATRFLRPTQQEPGVRFKKVDVHMSVACAVDVDGNVRCLGSTGATRTWDVPLLPMGGWTAISTSTARMCGVRNNALWCVGANYAGQAGQDPAMGVVGDPLQVGTDVGWTQVATGPDVTCGIRNGTAYCFGANGSQQLGHAGLGTHVPSDATAGDMLESLDVESSNVCGTTTDGKILCWGESRSGPTEVEAGHVWDAVGVGSNHLCAVEGGVVLCRGMHTAGEMGNGLGYQDYAPLGPVSGLDQVVALGTGGKTSCALRSNGAIFCWGSNHQGQCGTGSAGNKNVPTRVADSGFVAATGESTTCALSTTGERWCSGQAGQNQFGDTVVSRPMLGAVQDTAVYQRISQGHQHGCGIQLNDHALVCWGATNSPALGRTQVISPVPAPVAGGPSEWGDVAAGSSSSCGIGRADGGAGPLWCWGDNFLGHAVPGGAAIVPTPVEVVPGTLWLAASAGSYRTCGIQEDRSLWCWGSNDNAGLGSPDAGGGTMVQVGQEHDWLAVSAGPSFSCGVRETADAGLASLWCWGSVPPNNSVPGPQRLGTTVDWRSVAVGQGHACATDSMGGVRCFGSNYQGQLGNVDPNSQNSPTPVAQGGMWTSVMAGRDHTCGLQVDGSLWCWGSNGAAEIGDGTSFNSVPMRVVEP